MKLVTLPGALFLLQSCLFIQLNQPDIIPRRHCSVESICLEVESGRTDVKFYADNPTLAPVTFTVTFTTEGAIEETVKSPYTEVLAPNTSKLLFRLRSTNVVDEKKGRYNFSWRWGSPYATHDNSVIYRLPYQSDSSYQVTQGFNTSMTHQGESRYAIDWAMPENTPVLAAREGKVISLRHMYDESGLFEAAKDKANYVAVMHSDGSIGIYAHLAKNGIAVFVGQEVKAGDLLGMSGNTGYSSGPHLHFVVVTAKDGNEYTSYPPKFLVEDGTPQYLQSGIVYRAP